MIYRSCANFFSFKDLWRKYFLSCNIYIVVYRCKHWYKLRVREMNNCYACLNIYHWRMTKENIWKAQCWELINIKSINQSSALQFHFINCHRYQRLHPTFQWPRYSHKLFLNEIFFHQLETEQFKNHHK